MMNRTAIGFILAISALGAGAAPRPAWAAATAKIIEIPSERVSGIKGEGRVGDILLKNENVAFVIEADRPSSNQGIYGGLIADAGRILPDGGYGHNLFDDIVPVINGGLGSMFNARTFKPERVEIVRDGSDGGAAVVRATGRDDSFHFVDEMLGAPVPSLRLDIAIDYALAPGSAVLESVMRMTNRSGAAKTYGLGYVFFLGDGLELFTPVGGFNRAPLEKEGAELFGWVSRNISYGIESQGVPMTIYMNGGPILVVTGKEFKLEGGQSVEFARRVSVGEGDFESAWRPLAGNSAVRFEGAVELPAAAPEFAEVYVYRPGGTDPISMIRAGSGGRFAGTLEPGEYEFAASAPHYPAGGRVRAVVGPTGAEWKGPLRLPPAGFLEFEVVDGEGALMPATLAMDALSEIQANEAVRPIAPYGAGFERVEWTVSGKGTLSMPPGKYKVYASRGLEYEFDAREIELKPGETSAARFTVPRTVDTPGFIGGDFHVHSLGSNDSNDSYEEKVKAALGVGLEVPISTEHDHHGDYTPAIQALGVQGQTVPVTGVELTTIRWGHFNAFPLERDPEKPNNGAIDWTGMTVPQVFDRLRADPGEEIIQVNHPRSEAGSTGTGGYFFAAQYDPATGRAGVGRQWSADFDAIEVLNGSNHSEMAQTRLDWESFLNMGMPKTGAGNSDSHDAYHLDLGYPRNYVSVSNDDPAAFDMDEFAASVRNQRVTVDGGHFVTLSLNGDPATLGKTFHEAGGVYRLKVLIQAPSWVDLKKVEIVENGAVVQSIDAGAFSGSGPLRFEKVVELKPARDAWYIVHTYGENDLYPVYPGAKPRSFTNPFWIDVDGDGKFKPLIEPEN